MSSKKALPPPPDPPTSSAAPSSEPVQPAHPTDPEPAVTDDEKANNNKKYSQRKKKKKKSDEEKKMKRYLEAMKILEAPNMPVLFKPDDPADPSIPRDKWGAFPPRVPFPPRGPSFTRVLCSDTKGETCSTEAQCCEVVRQLQYHYMKELGKDDLPYNFLVGGDGEVYEGRGWYHNSPFPIDDLPEYLNDGSILHIGYMGDFESENGIKPSEDMVTARRTLCEYGVQAGHLEDDHPVMTQLIAKV